VVLNGFPGCGAAAPHLNVIALTAGMAEATTPIAQAPARRMKLLAVECAYLALSRAFLLCQRFGMSAQESP